MKKKNEYPNSKTLKNLLSKHGLNPEEAFRISVVDVPENDRVGYIWKGERTTKTMEGMIDTLALNDLTIRFAKIGEDRGLIYINRYS